MSTPYSFGHDTRAKIALLERPVLLAVLALSLSLGILLSYQLRASTPTPPDGPTIGSVAPTLRLRSLTGRTTTIDYSAASKGTVLYAFSSRCAWCQRNTANIVSLVSALDKHYQVFIYATQESDELTAYAERYGLAQRTYILQPNSLGARDLSVVPQTLVVDRNGCVLKVWRGAYIDDVKSDIETFFGLTLPGVS